MSMKKNNHNSIDYKELYKFNYYCKHWWNKTGIFKLLHKIHKLHLEYILKISNGIFKKRILDVGCGGGIFTEMMFKEGAIVYGLDINSKLIDIAKKHAKNENISIKYLHESIRCHMLKNKEEYDIVTCMEVLEHTSNWQEMVTLCLKLVKSGGNVFFSTLNRNLKSWFFAILCAEYLLNIVPRGMHSLKKFIKPSEILSITDNFLISKKNIIGVKYNIFSEKFYFSKNIDINYILHIKK